MLKYSLLCLLAVQAIRAQAQPIIFAPLEANQNLHPNPSQTAEQTLYTRAQTCPSQTLSLPFFDDFAKIDSFYPKCSHWQDNQAFINYTYAYNPPSVGVATLEGLNQYGRPYELLSSTSIPSPADTLTSQQIDLSGRTAASRVVLSFYYQQQGLGDRPEGSDSLILEFKNSLGVWTNIRNWAGVAQTVSALVIPGFNRVHFPITDTAYLHAGFQFRFRNLATVTGNNDHWNIDYVFLDANRDTNNVNSPDVSFSQIPASAFKYYESVPYRHFQDTMWQDSFRMYCQNLSASPGTLDRKFNISDKNSGLILADAQTPALNYVSSPNPQDTTIQPIGSPFAAYTASDTSTIRSVYTILNPSGFQSNPIYAFNDTVYKENKLTDYFAYDDGSAEARIIAQGVGTKVAVQYHTTIADTLRGIYFHLPFFNNRDAEQDFINVKVWLSSLNNEVFTKDIYRLRYTGGFNGLYYMELTNFDGQKTPIGIPANTRFYVGWEQASTIPVPVGFDRNSDARARTFYYANGQWQNFSQKGAALVRPLLNPNPNYPIVGVEKALSQPNEPLWGFSPNPAQAHLNLFWAAENLSQPETVQIYNLLGMSVLNAPFSSEISVNELPAGAYLVQIRTQTGQIYTKKMLKQ